MSQLSLASACWAIGAAGPNIRQTHMCVRYYIRLRVLLYLVECATTLHSTLVLALAYCIFLREVRLGGCGTEQGCAENWAPIVDIPNFGSFLPKNWVGVGLWVSIYENWG